jgi:hypothetical protein
MPDHPPLSSVSNEDARGALGLEKGNKKGSLSAADKSKYSTEYTYTQPYTDILEEADKKLNN